MSKISSTRLITALLGSALATDAAAQTTPPGTINLLAPAAPAASRTAAPNPAALGRNAGTVAAVHYAPLSPEAAASFRVRSNTPQSMRIPLPGGRSVTCALRPASTGDGRLVMSGAPTIG